jgi:protein O-mannosyl-transferase
MSKTGKSSVISPENIFGFNLPFKLQTLIILLLTFLAYIPVLQNGFTYFSDDNYVLNNAIIQHLSWNNIRFIFTSYFDGHYHPLTMLSLGLTYKMGGTSPLQYQWTNLLLHLANTLLVFWLIRKLFRNQEMAFFVALLFGLHTIHVESVARITERKDMLYTFFYLLSAIAYINFLDRKRWKFYLFSLFTFTFSLLSKGQAVTLFFTVLLIDYYRDRSVLSGRVILEKLPFLFLSMFFGYLNLQAQKYTGYFLDYKSMAVYEPLLDAAYVLTHYIFKMLLPVRLSALYPYPNNLGETIPAYMWIYLVTFILLIYLSYYYFKRNKLVFFGIMFYLLNIFMMLRIIPVAENIMPDRYNYIPSIGFFIILYGFYLFIKNHKSRFLEITRISIAVYFVILFILTFLRTQVWKSGETVWFDAYSKYPRNTYILQNVANLQISQQKYREGFATIDKAMAAAPQNVLALISRIKANAALRHDAAVEKDLNYLRSLEPALAENIENRANALFLYGDLKRDGPMILDSYKLAIEKYPSNAKFYFNLGVFNYATKNYTDAINNLQKGISYKPYTIDYYYLYLGMAKFQLKETEAAADAFRIALKYNPKNKEVKKWLKNTSPAP